MNSKKGLGFILDRAISILYHFAYLHNIYNKLIENVTPYICRNRKPFRMQLYLEAVQKCKVIEKLMEKNQQCVDAKDLGRYLRKCIGKVIQITWRQSNLWRFLYLPSSSNNYWILMKNFCWNLIYFESYYGFWV